MLLPLTHLVRPTCGEPSWGEEQLVCCKVCTKWVGCACLVALVPSKLLCMLQLWTGFADSLGMCAADGWLRVFAVAPVPGRLLCKLAGAPGAKGQLPAMTCLHVAVEGPPDR